MIESDEKVAGRLELELVLQGNAVHLCHAINEARVVAEQHFDLVVIGPSVHRLDIDRFVRGSNKSDHGPEPVVIVFRSERAELDSTALHEAGVAIVSAWPITSDYLQQRIAEARSLIERGNNHAESGSGQGRSTCLVVLRTDGAVQQAGPIAEQVLGYPPEALLGINAFGLFHPDDAPVILSLVTEALAASGRSRIAEVRARRDADSWRTLAISVTTVGNGALADGIAIEAHGREARLHSSSPETRAVMHDPVTDLPNRALFVDRIQHALARASRRKAPVVVMTLDVSDFGRIGQASMEPRESVVLEVAQRLRTCLRDSDTAGRLGYDEFGVLLEDINDGSDASIVADRIVRALGHPIPDGVDELRLPVKVGIVVDSGSGADATVLMRNADAARAWAHVDRTVDFALFDPTIHTMADLPGSTSSPEIHEGQSGVSMASTTSPGIDSQLAALHERLRFLEQKIDNLGRLAVHSS